MEAGKKARKNVTFLDVTFSVQKSMTVLHASFESREVKARGAAERARDAPALNDGSGTGAAASGASAAAASGASAADTAVAADRLAAELESAPNFGPADSFVVATLPDGARCRRLAAPQSTRGPARTRDDKFQRTRVPR